MVPSQHLKRKIKDVREKSETLQVIREQITSCLRELRSRKADVKMLEQLYEEQKLAEVSGEEIEAQKEHLMEEEKLLQDVRKKYRSWYLHVRDSSHRQM